MNKLTKLLLATVLTAAAILSMPPKASAGSIWCNECLTSGSCFACCRCAGGTTGECVDACPN